MQLSGFYLCTLSGKVRPTSIFIIMHSLPIAQTAKSDIWELHRESASTSSKPEDF